MSVRSDLVTMSSLADVSLLSSFYCSRQNAAVSWKLSVSKILILLLEAQNLVLKTFCGLPIGITYLLFTVIFLNKKFIGQSIDHNLKGSLKYFIILFKSLHVKNCPRMRRLCNIIASVNWGVGGVGVKE